MTDRQRIVIVGGGFAGLNAARSLRRADVQVTLVDRRNFHLFQPLLYQVATGGLSPGNIAAPLRSILRRQRNIEVLLAEVTDFDLAVRRLKLADGELSYDTLIVCTGAQTGYFGHGEWAKAAPGLKSIEDALDIRHRILSAFEAAERETDPQRQREWLTFVIVGGGPTGVELAGTLAEIASHTLKYDYRHINPADARIVLIDLADRVLAAFPPDLSAAAADRLRRMSIELRTSTRVQSLDAGSVVLQPTAVDAKPETIAAHTILWAAGVEASPLGRKLAAAAGCETDRMGRIIVQPDLTLPNHPEVFVLGDLAHCADKQGKPLPGVAPTAIQQGQYAARLIVTRLRGQSLPPFEYFDYGNMATIGRSAAVAQLGRWKFTGFTAWLIWLFVHLMQLVRFENRVLVLIQWAWNYVTFNRSARLITDVAALRSDLLSTPLAPLGRGAGSEG